MASTNSGAQPQSRSTAMLPRRSLPVCSPAAMRRAAWMIFWVTNRSGRRGLSWLNRMPEHANNP